ncbi:site-specific integrase [Halorhabdus amylolytica]|uniref:site-specific integrase n=1 Tax=Halorhabdus amylolytica TaxID=2559573 RepID=UPI0010AA07E5|nr:site-specific integrase [Halorhabdus amylolytica]
MTNPRKNYREARGTLQNAIDSGDVTEADGDRIQELCNAYDPENMTVMLPSEGEYANDTKSKKPTTLRYWMQHLKRAAQRIAFEEYDTSLTEATADDINQLMTDLRSGRHPDVKDDGLANNTIRNEQGCIRRFYRYHADLGVDPDDITLISGDDTHVDDRDMLTKEEIEEIRESADHPRDLAIFDLLLYTGQRNTAIRSLRIKDIDLDEGVYYLNTEAEGLKGADENGSKRPLLGAVGSIREWLRYHPFSDNPDAYLITPKPRYSNPDPDQMVSTNTLQYAMKNLKEKAEIDKPLNPHSIRHNFVTIAKREYHMDDATVKHLIGHSPDSNVMETTYSHLSDEDHIRAAEEAAGIREAKEESTLSPDICHTCGEPLGPGAKACPRCGTVYTPDAKAAENQMDDKMTESYKQTDPDDTETMDKIDTLDELLDDPEIKQMLYERMNEEDE